MNESHRPTPRGRAFFSGSVLLLLLAGGAILAAIVAAVFSAELVGLGIRLYSRTGTVTGTGLEMMQRVVARARGMFLLGGVGCLGMAWLFHRAERAMGAAPAPVPEGSREPEARWLLWLMAALALLRAALNWEHLHDSLWCDELYSWKNFAGGSIAGIFGVSKSNLPNNHVLNSLLMKLSLSLGLESEAGLRLWSFAASLGAVPAAWLLGRVFRLRPLWTALLMLLAATSPVIERYGTQARGYGLAILLAMLSVALHVSLFESAARWRRIALIFVNALLVLANLYTITLLVGELLHLLAEGLVPRSASRREGHPGYRGHLFSLLVSLLLSLGLNLLLIPFIILNSVVFAMKTPHSAAALLQTLSGTLLPLENRWLGVFVLLALAALAAGSRGRRADRGAWALLAIFGCGIGAGIAMHLYELRAVAYLNGLTLLLFAIIFERVRLGRLLAPTATILALLVAGHGARFSLQRPVIQDYRGMIAAAERLADGRPLWTSGFASEGVDYYRALPTPERMPAGPSVYLSFFEWEVKNDPLQQAAWSACRLRQAIPSELKMAIYECPAARRPGGPAER